MLQLVESASQDDRLFFNDIYDADAHELDKGFLATKHPLMKSLIYSISIASQCDSTVLITGETGTGKRKIAEAIHKRSSRSHMPLVTIDCAVLVNQDLLVSELFGHKKGSFSSANEDRHGLFDAGNGSTVVIDEIEALPPESQKVLLRVLEERKIRKLGVNIDKSINVRIIAITNRDLSKMVRNRSFREDLYYRLRVLNIEAPSLRATRDDILALAAYYIKICRPDRFPEVSISKNIANTLINYSWPGNYRELKHAIESTLADRSKNHIDSINLDRMEDDENDGKYGDDSKNNSQFCTLEEMQKKYILRVLKYCNGNVTSAARVLGLERGSIYRKLKEYGVDSHDYKA